MSEGRARPARATERGFALVVVLMFLVLISAIGAYLLAGARVEVAIAHNVRAAAANEALADAGVYRAIFNQSGMGDERWKTDGSPIHVKLSYGDVTIRISDETKKVNPNLASEALLTALFEATGTDRAHAQRLGAAVADWVGKESDARPLVAKLEQYRAAGRSYGPPNGPMQTIEELQLVLGMTPETYKAVRPYLTLYTSIDKPDADGAPMVIRNALALAAHEQSETDATADGSAPNAAPTAPQPNAPSQTAAQANQGPAAPQAGNAPGASANKPPERVLAINVVATDHAGGTFVRDAIVKFDGSNSASYTMLDWRRGELAAN